MLHRPRRVGSPARERLTKQERPSGWRLRPTPRGFERASTALRLHTVRLLAPADSPWWCHPPAVQARLALYNATTLASIATRRIPHMDYLCMPCSYFWGELLRIPKRRSSLNYTSTHSGE